MNNLWRGLKELICTVLDGNVDDRLNCKFCLDATRSVSCRSSLEGTA